MRLSGWAKFHAGCSTGLVLAMTLAVNAAGQTSSTPKRATKHTSAKSETKHSPKKPEHATHERGSEKTSTHRKATKGKLVVKHHHIVSKPTAKSIRLTKAFTASAQLRPMAQQLAATRAQAAYAGVLNYAAAHPGEGAAAAYLAV
jgi:soluble lytic murein transglycosylase